MTLNPVTPEPTSRTVPENSWPNVMGSVSPVTACGFMGAKLGPPRYSWRSEGFSNDGITLQKVLMRGGD